MDANLLKDIVKDLMAVITSEYKAPEQKAEAADTLVQAVAPKYAATMRAVQKNHAQYGDDLCWMDNKEIWAAAELPIPERFVGDKVAMLRNCERFVDTVCIEGGPWKSYADLEKDLRDILSQLQQAANSWRSQADSGVAEFPPRKLALLGCASTVETIINKYKEKKTNAEGNCRVAASGG